MASGSQNMTTYNARIVTGSNGAASPGGALLQSGTGRADNATGDTWIFLDTLGGTSSPWGIKHDQANNKILFYGSGTNSAWTRLNTGDTYLLGKLGLGYNPETSGNTEKLYVNGTSYLKGNTRINGSLHLHAATYGNTASDMISGTGGLFSWGDKGPQITFDTSATPGGGQAGALIYTDHDTAATGVSWHFVSNQGDWNVTSKRFHARTSISIGSNLPNTSYNLVVAGSTFHNGVVYFGNGTTYFVNNSAVAYFNDLRSDNVRLVDNWVGFYQNANAGGNRYGYVQANENRMYFRKENGVSTYHFDFNGHIYTSGGFYSAGSPGLNVTTAAGTWSYVRLHNGSNFWDFATKSDHGSGALEMRIAGGDTGYYFNTGDMPAGAANLSAAAAQHSIKFYRNGLAIPYQMDNVNDGGILRVRGTSETTTVLELGTWDDSGSGETIQFNYYPTTSQITPTYSIAVPKETGTIFLRVPWWTNGNGNNADTLRHGCTFAYTNHNCPTNGTLAAFDCSTNENYTLQLQGQYNGDALYFRNRNGDNGTWRGWQRVVHNSGTWSISVTGSAGSVAWANVTGKPSSYAPSAHTNHSSIELFPGATNAGHGGFIDFHFNNSSADYTSRIIEWSSGTLTVYTNLTATKVSNAVWNDFAEFRESDIHESGRVLVSNGSGKLVLSTERLQPAAHIISDTFGCSVGQSDTAQTPMGVAGRVLAYPYQDRNNYKVGDAVCAAPNGTIDIMTREEIIQYPDRIIGIVDEIPNYAIWSQVSTQYDGNGKYGGCHKAEVEVNGRIWVYVK